MSEKIKILEMIREGIISPEEGERLLSAMDSDKRDSQVQQSRPSGDKNVPFRMLRIRILSKEGDKVNVNIPVSFAKIALKSGKGFQFGGNETVGQIFENMDVDQLLDLIESGALGEIVNVDSADGDQVKIYID